MQAPSSQQTRLHWKVSPSQVRETAMANIMPNQPKLPPNQQKLPLTKRVIFSPRHRPSIPSPVTQIQRSNSAPHSHLHTKVMQTANGSKRKLPRSLPSPRLREHEASCVLENIDNKSLNQSPSRNQVTVSVCGNPSLCLHCRRISVLVGAVQEK